MPRVLLVDDDSSLVAMGERLLRSAGYECRSALTGANGLQIGRRFAPDVALVDLSLPDMSGINVIRKLRTDAPRTACVVVTGYPSLDYAVDALRVGACDWLTKPTSNEQLLGAVARAITGVGYADPTDVYVGPAEPHAVRRLADASVRFISSPRDRPTLDLLGHEIGHSKGGLRNWCRTARLESKVFRDFTRALRAVVRLEQQPDSNDANLLEMIDDRTRRKFRILAGGSESRFPASVNEFFDRQQFITDPEFVTTVRCLLRSTTIHFGDPAVATSGPDPVASQGDAGEASRSTRAPGRTR